MKKKFELRLASLEQLLRANHGHPMKVSSLQSTLREELGQELSSSQIIYAIRELRKTLQDPTKLQIIGGGEVVLRGKRRVDELRDQTNADTKLRVAHVFWHFLFGRLSPGKEAEWYCVPPLPPQSSDRWNNGLAERLAALRARHGVNLLVDSGSSTKAVVTSLLASEDMPFEAGEPPPLDASKWVSMETPSRYILPTLFTNSPRVAVDVLDSPHVDRFEVRVIGGVVRGRYGSVAGELAQTCLEAWGHTGKSIRYDVAVVGTTGVRDSFSGGKAFGVEHLEEATLKTHLLSEAQVRCVVMDVSKLLKDEVNSVFAPINGRHVDIVFLDFGTPSKQLQERKKDTPQALVLDFASMALSKGVLPVIVMNDEADFVREKNVRSKRKSQSDGPIAGTLCAGNVTFDGWFWNTKLH